MKLSIPRVPVLRVLSVVLAVSVLAMSSPALAKSTKKLKPTTTSTTLKKPGPDIRYPPKTLDLYQKVVSRKVTNNSGHRLPASSKPKAGERVATNYREYMGSRSKHASSSTGSGTLTCTYSSTSEATCSGQLVLGGSALLIKKVQVDFATKPTDIAVTGGTGSFANYHGLITVMPVVHSSNANLVVLVARRPPAISK